MINLLTMKSFRCASVQAELARTVENQQRMGSDCQLVEQRPETFCSQPRLAYADECVEVVPGRQRSRRHVRPGDALREARWHAERDVRSRLRLLRQ